MYEEFETKTSYKYLKEVIKVLDEPICILGGWAVFFKVNKNFQNLQGRPYLGSRDIDLGFHLDKDCSETDLKKSSLMEALKILKEKMKFKPLGFRVFKDVHTETEEEIQEGQFVPPHFRFPMYVDPIVDNIPANFKKIIGFQPIDEPLLRFLFDGEKQYVKEFGRKLLLPKSELLVAMKINCLPNRSKEHKRVKDLCDMFSLIWYNTEDSMEGLMVKVLRLIPKKNLTKCVKVIDKDLMEKASPQINHSVADIERVVGILK